MGVLERRLSAHESVGIWLEGGSEVFCAGGAVRVGEQVLTVGMGWRAAQARWVSVEAVQASRIRVTAPATCAKRVVGAQPRFAGSVRRWVAALS